MDASGKRPDYVILLITLALVSFGTAMIYSSSFILAESNKHDGYYFLKRQLAFFGVGLLLMLRFLPDRIR